MVDIRPLLFINALLLMLLITAGIAKLPQSVTEPPTQSAQVEDNSAANTENEPNSEEDPIFADEVLLPHKDPEILASIANVEFETPPPIKPSAETTEPATASPKPKPIRVTTGKLIVRSNVYGDTVLINGTPYGATKLEIDLSPGAYQIEVSKPGYQSWARGIDIRRGASLNLLAQLDQNTTVNYVDGIWRNDVKTGTGRYQDGARIDYQGSFINGLFHGKGSARYGNGSKYNGEWFEGSKKGQGSFTSSSGDTYVGEFADDEYNGDGTLTKITGDIFTGYWINGELNGQGSLTTRDGLLYVGSFTDNLFHGQGSLTFPNGGHYEGSFSNGMFHGKGTEVYANGKKYDGQFIEGLYHGKGELLNPNGSKISGTFKDGVPFGKVTLTTAEGEIFTARSSEPGVCYRPKSYRATECPSLDGW